MNFYENNFEETQSKFNIGDLVMLNSGGPIMSILLLGEDYPNILGEEKYGCFWHDKEQYFHYSNFHISCIKLIETKGRI